MRIRWTTCAAVLLGGGFVFGVAATPAASKEPWAMEDGTLRPLPAVDSSTSQASTLAPPMQALAYPEGIKTPEPATMASASITNWAITGPVSVEQLVMLARRDNPEISAARYKASSMLCACLKRGRSTTLCSRRQPFWNQFKRQPGPRRSCLVCRRSFLGSANATHEVKLRITMRKLPSRIWPTSNWASSNNLNWPITTYIFCTSRNESTASCDQESRS